MSSCSRRVRVIALVAVSCGVASPGAVLGATANEPIEVVKGVVISATRDWSVRARTPNSVELVRQGPGEGVVGAHTLVLVENGRDHAEALRRLGEIASERGERPSFRLIAGWPALERRRIQPLAHVDAESDKSQAAPFQPQPATRITTAVAADNLLVRLETTLSPGIDGNLAAEAQALGRGLRVPKVGPAQRSQSELDGVRKAIAPPKPGGKPGPKTGQPPPPPQPAPRTAEGGIGGGGPGPGASVNTGLVINGGRGELQVAVSANGQHVVVGTNPGWGTSHDGGGTFTSHFSFLLAGFPHDGDPALAAGLSGAFYYAFIGYPDGTAAALSQTGCAAAVARSTDNGDTFPIRGFGGLCPWIGASMCFTDQEMIAADRVNASGTGGDQVYVTWRNFTPMGTPPANCRGIQVGTVVPKIACSNDGGQTFGAPVTVGAGDTPKPTVGPDGNVYVTYLDPTNSTIVLQKFTSCTAGLATVGAAVTVASGLSLTCPIAGLDRCPTLSPTPVVDDLEPNHVFVGYASSSGAGENVVVADSEDGAATFPRTVVVNSGGTTRRFLNWLCATGGRAYAGWYDRRTSTIANNDLTRFHFGAAWVHGGSLVGANDLDLSGVDDAQCASGWPCGTRSTADSETCSVQPQLAGLCWHTPPTPPADTLSSPPCDFNEGPACPLTGETCQTNGGCPKYGDYNGVACIAGRFYGAWASATPPLGVTGSSPGIDVYENTVLLPSDFFVRDWTTSATSHDDGVEPSTNPDFFDFSDVWSQSTSTPAAPVNDWVLGEPAHKGAGTPGDNFAFVRISRRVLPAPTAPSVGVGAHFLFADYGLGVPYVDAGTTADPTLTFAATDLMQTLASGYLYHVGLTASSHVCLAVVINAPGDPPIGPTLVGTSPGPDDPLFLADNNKAQRNLSTVLGTSTAGMAAYAIVHNIGLDPRTIQVRVSADPNALESLRGTTVGVVGGKQQPLTSATRLALDRMQPGENRWVGIRFGKLGGQPGTLMPVRFQEIGSKGRLGSGFTVAARVAPLPVVARENLLSHRDAALRRVAGFNDAEARAEVEAITALLNEKELGVAAYVEFLKAHLPALEKMARATLEAEKGGDQFRLLRSLQALKKALASGDSSAAATEHGSLTQALDAQLTKVFKDQGDEADILQMVKWQRALFARHEGLQPARAIVARSAEFIERWEGGHATAADYPALLEGLLAQFDAAADRLGDREAAERAVGRIRAALHVKPAALEKAHRQYLLLIPLTAKTVAGKE